ncbi:MAG: PRD domain-containing protein [Desulfitobacteriaceae bacterium]|nr:PRD domain-containing protein [Desulfitobacteriaceae bacterium]
MEYQNVIAEKLGISRESKEERALIRSAFAYCSDVGIEFSNIENKALAFANHILQLKTRLDQGTDFPEIESSITDQVPLKYRNLAVQLLNKLFPKFKIPYSEVVFVAIHLSVAAAETN